MPHRDEINLPPLNRPQRPNTDHQSPNTGRYHDQNADAIGSAIVQRTHEIGSSLQRLDRQLSEFEERYALAAVNRVEQVGIRIEQKIAAILQAREVERTGFNLSDAIETVDVPVFDLPPAIAPSTAMGCLPM